jgi:hypothetical protein
MIEMMCESTFYLLARGTCFYILIDSETDDYVCIDYFIM